MRKLILLLMQSRLYAWLLKHVIPFIRFTTYYPSLGGYKYHIGYMELKPGMFVLCTDKKKLTSLLIPGTFSHAALCVQKGNTWWPEIFEMTHTDWTESWFYDLCRQSDRVAIFTCMLWDDAYAKDLLAKAWSFRGAKYDSQFELGVKALYCSELIYLADYEHRLGCDLSDLAGLGRDYISPDGLAMAKNAICVWDSDNELTGLYGPEIESRLSKESK